MTARFSWRRWLGRAAPILTIQVFHREVAYLVRSGARVYSAGVVALPDGAVRNGRLLEPELLMNALSAHIDDAMTLDVAVVLPSGLTHLQYLTLPVGLDAEEMDYQATRHISQTLGLSLGEVFYDLSPHKHLLQDRNETVLLVARQTEVAQYGAAFMQSNWHLRWVCAESLIWATASFDVVDAKSLYKNHGNTQTPSTLVCQCDYDGLQMWWTDVNGHAHHQVKLFDATSLSQAGFVYRSDDTHTNQSLQLPTRFGVDEIETAAKQWLGESLSHMVMLQGTGTGLDWSQARAQLQSRLGMPVRSLRLPDEAGVRSDALARLGCVWQLSEQVRAAK